MFYSGVGWLIQMKTRFDDEESHEVRILALDDKLETLKASKSQMFIRDTISMTESLAGADLQQQLQPLCALKTLAEKSGKTDQLTLNNMVFLAQKMFSFRELYSDFRGFGKLGVSSPSLGWEYNRLYNVWEDLPKEVDSEIVKQTMEIAGKFRQLSHKEIALLACFLFDQKILNEDEKSASQEVLEKIRT